MGVCFIGLWCVVLSVMCDMMYYVEYVCGIVLCGV